MPIRAPLVLVNGQVQQLQAGDTILAAMSTYNARAMTNGEAAAALTIGMAVYPSAVNAVRRAQANAGGTARPIGLVLDPSIAAAASGAIVTDGVLTATTAQWDAVTGLTGGLVFNTTYYLDPTTPGKITPTPPSTVGQYVVPIGTALSTTDLEVSIGQSILL